MTIVDAATHPPVQNWPDAVRAAAQLLVDMGSAASSYPQACVDVVHEHGPYIVLTPGLALVHARPETGGVRMGVAVLRLDRPVHFGHETNDPVDLLVAFSSPDHQAHVETLSHLARALGAGLAERLRAAESVGSLRQTVKEVLDAD
ncbi:MAG TPA: PTS sugar transporter subunit IIA [Nocardioidaceae bacterium]|nr:PTS sugar transporter subunit IIA [Nocardioidaceae bacterium]